MSDEANVWRPQLVGTTYASLVDVVDTDNHFTNVNVETVLDEIAESRTHVVDSILALISTPTSEPVFVKGFYDGTYIDGGNYSWVASQDKNTADGYLIVDPTTTGGFDGTAGTASSYFAAQGTGVGLGCWVLIRKLVSTKNSIYELIQAPRGGNLLVTGFYSGSYSGGGHYSWSATTNKNTANGVTIIDPATTGGFDGTTGTLSAYLAAQGTGVGTGCWILSKTTFPTLIEAGGTCDGIVDDISSISNLLSIAELEESTVVILGAKYTYSATSFVIPDSITFGNIEDIKGYKNLIPNGNFHTWQRVDVNLLSPAQFTYSPPTFGNAATYEGSSGLAVYHADMWYCRHYGYTGNGVITRVQLTPAEIVYNSRSQYKLNWVGNSVAVPVALDVAITNITTPAATPVTITAPGHGLVATDYIYLKGTTYTGGNLTIDGTYQVSNVIGDNFDVTVVPDAGFSAWTAFGNATNDPFFQTYEHLYDPAVSAWIRNGTAGQQLAIKIPTIQNRGGYYTIRLRAKVNSGNASFYPRMGHDYGSGGSPTGTVITNCPGITLQSTYKDFVSIVKLPDISGNTFGSSVDTGYFYFGLDSGAPEVSHDIDIISISVRPGIAAVVDDNKSREDEYSYLREFYRGVRMGTQQTTILNNYYGDSHSFDPPMRGTPVVTYVRDIYILNFNTPALVNNVTKEGFMASAQATSAAANQWSSIFECEYKIPT